MDKGSVGGRINRVFSGVEMRILLIVFSFALAFGQVSVPTDFRDNTLVNTNTSETALTPPLVIGGLGLQGTFSVASGDFIFSQPLYIPSVTIAAHVYNVLIATSLANNIYAFDADSPGSAALWTQNFGTGRAWWSNNTDENYYVTSGIGTVGTPVVDATGGFIYFVTATITPTYVLNKLNLVDGTTALSTVITGQVTGTGSTGDPTSGPNLLFSPTLSNQRPGLVLSADKSKVYIAFGGGSAGIVPPPWHGWMFSYNTADLSQAAVFCTTPNGWGGSIWGGPPAIDSSGNLYVITGSEGVWDGVTEFPDTILKLSPSLALLDWFTPSNHATLDANDYDFGSNRVMLIPGSTIAVGAGKDFNVYAVDTTCMGHLQGSSGCSLQTFKTNAAGTVTKFSGSYGGTFMNNVLYLPTTAGSIYAFTWNPGSSLFTTTPVATNLTSYGSFGPAQMSGSCNGTSNCILWVATTSSGQSSFTATHAGTLRAMNPADLTEYWNSSSTLGLLAKFSSPVTANGRVYVPTQSGYIAVYEISSTFSPGVVIRGKVQFSGQVTIR